MNGKSFFYYIFNVLKYALYPFAIIYGAIVWLRNKLYDSRFFSSIEFSLPVITVGNLSTGGTGKTPHVEYLINLLRYRYQIATMSRGYKRNTQGFLLADENADAQKIGDEPMQYYLKFPEVTVSVAEERITGIPNLLQRRPAIEVVLLDDAYQHRSVKAGMNILITDYARPFYDDHILPFGNLREGRNAYQRADIIVVSKCREDISSEQAAEIVNKIMPLPHQKVFFTNIAYWQPYNMMSKETVSIAAKNIILVCCIARPEPLINYLKRNATSVHPLTWNDHHYFTAQDIEEIKSAYDNMDVANKIIVTTEKDATRLHLFAKMLHDLALDIIVIPIKVNVLFDKGNELDTLILGYVESTIAENMEQFPE